MQNKKKLLLLSLIQFILLFALLGSILYFKQTADTFKVESQSIDPIEPLYGHYADLSYTFDELSEKDWKGKAKPEIGKKVYVVFKKKNRNLYDFDYLTDQRPEKSKYIKATITNMYDYDDSGVQEIDIHHNLDQFYIPENRMDEYNQPNQKYIVTIQYKNDRAVIKSLEVLK